MALDVHFKSDIRRILDALRQANERTLSLAERYGLNMEVAEIYKEIYGGALDDVAAAFGAAEQTTETLTIPMRVVEWERQPQPWERDGRGPLSM